MGYSPENTECNIVSKCLIIRCFTGWNNRFTACYVRLAAKNRRCWNAYYSAAYLYLHLLPELLMAPGEKAMNNGGHITKTNFNNKTWD
jgi:hypothetical protein